MIFVLIFPKSFDNATVTTPMYATLEGVHTLPKYRFALVYTDVYTDIE